MSEGRGPAALTQGDVEILVARELRKAGLALSPLRVRRRLPLEGEEGRWTMLLEGRLHVDGADAPLLVECHDRAAPVAAAPVRALAETARAAKADRAMLVSTSGFASPAVAAGAELGIALLAIVDGASAWRSSPWSSGRPPAWFPEFVAQLVFEGDAGLVRTEILQPDRAAMVLERLRPLAADERG